jgi:stress-induced-phosphoprotein 1
MEHDEGGKNAREIEQQQQKALEAMYAARAGETEEETSARIQKDPEISKFHSIPVPNLASSREKEGSRKN